MDPGKTNSLLIHDNKYSITAVLKCITSLVEEMAKCRNIRKQAAPANRSKLLSAINAVKSGKVADTLS